jgi:HAE1 family hydrophobic/amphiphilic exporter-1
LPGDAELTTAVRSVASSSKHAISDVKKDAMIGGLLAMLIIFLFLRDGWSTFVISLISIPVSIITTFFFMGQLRTVAEHDVAGRPRAGHRPGGRRRHRGAGEHRQGARAWAGILQAAITGTREVPPPWSPRP